MIAEKLYLMPGSIEEAQKYITDYADDMRIVAGGTDVIVNRFHGNDSSACMIDITGIEELKKITRDGNYLKIGSLVQLDDLCTNPDISREFPVLSDAVHYVASPVIRKTATIGGNVLCENRCMFYNQSEWWRDAIGHCLKCGGEVCIATGGDKNCFSKFASDMAVALISLNAKLEVITGDKVSITKLEDIYTGRGAEPRTLSKSSLIKAILLPLGENFKSVFKKLRQRESLEFSSLSTAVSVNKTGNVKIVLGGVDPKPVVVEGTNKSDKPELIKQATKKARIVDNDGYSRVYRKSMIGVFLERSFQELSI